VAPSPSTNRAVHESSGRQRDQAVGGPGGPFPPARRTYTRAMISPPPESGGIAVGYGSRTVGFPVWVLVGPALAACLGAFLLAVTIGPEWTAIRLALDLSSLAAVWIFLAYLLPAMVALPVGILAGRRWPTAVVLPAIVLLIVGSLLTAFSSGNALLLLGRAVTGFGAGLAWGVTAALVRRLAVGRAQVAPAIAGASVLSLVLGPVVGAVLSQAMTWRWTVLVAVPFEAVAFLVTAVSGIVLLVLRASRPVPPPPVLLEDRGSGV
jgi:hypothetical protein